MKVEVVSHDFPVTETMVHLIEGHLRNLLAWNWSEVRKVHITLGDFAGLGGPQKLCSIRIDLSQGDSVRSAKVATHLRSAMADAISSAERGALERIRRVRRRRGLGILF